MQRTLITLILALIPGLSFAGTDNSRDLCEDVLLGPDGSPIMDSHGQTISRFCEPTGPEPPVWADDLCCTFGADGAKCSPADENGRCTVGAKMWCEYGEQTGGEVTCYKPYPTACELGYCIEAEPMAEPIDSHLICCYADINICFPASAEEMCEGGVLGVCYWGLSNEDGTITCHEQH